MTLTKMNFLKKKLGNKIRALRIAKGFRSQKAFAGALGLTQPTVSRWERGENYPSEEHFPLLTELLKISKEDLASDSFHYPPVSPNNGTIMEPMHTYGSGSDELRKSITSVTEALAAMQRIVNDLNDRIARVEELRVTLLSAEELEVLKQIRKSKNNGSKNNNKKR